MFKWIGRIMAFGLMLVIVLVIGAGMYGYFTLKAGQPPAADKAAYSLQAYYLDKGDLKIPTRIYYAEAVKIQDGNAVLNGYWTYDGAKYHHQDGLKEISPPFDIIRRGQ